MLKATDVSRISEKQASAGITALVLKLCGRKMATPIVDFSVPRAVCPAPSGFGCRTPRSVTLSSLSGCDHTSGDPGLPGTLWLTGESQIPADISANISWFHILCSCRTRNPWCISRSCTGQQSKAFFSFLTFFINLQETEQSWKDCTALCRENLHRQKEMRVMVSKSAILPVLDLGCNIAFYFIFHEEAWKLYRTPVNSTTT